MHRTSRDKKQLTKKEIFKIVFIVIGGILHAMFGELIAAVIGVVFVVGSVVAACVVYFAMGTAAFVVTLVIIGILAVPVSWAIHFFNRPCR